MRTVVFPIAEHLRTRELDAAADPPDYFPLLVKASASDALYRVTYFKDLSPNDVPVLDIVKSAVPSINKHIGNRTNTPFGKILSLNSGNGFTDLWVEAKNPEWVRGWYRIEDGKIIPQKFHMYTRGIGYGFGPFLVPVCVIIAFCIVKFISKKVEQRALRDGVAAAPKP